jgi:hypothetical protein
MSVNHNLRLAVVLVAGLTCRFVLAQGPWIMEPIVRDGDPVPDVPGRVFAGALSGTAIDNSGAVAFFGGWFQPGMSPPFGSGIFYGTPTQISLIQLQGQPAPGFPGPNDFLQYWFPSGPRLSKTGLLGLRAQVGSIYPGNKQGQYVGPPSNLQLAAYTGGPAPGAPSGTVDFIVSQAILNSYGQIAYTTGIYDAGAPNGIGYSALLTGTAGDQTMIARTTFPVEAIPDATYALLYGDAGGMAINDPAQVLFKANFTGPGVPTGTGQAYFQWSPEGSVVLARLGMQAPTLPPGVTFAGFGLTGPGLSNTGRAEFIAALQGPAIDASNAWGVWSGSPDALEPFIRGGDPTLGLEEHETFWAPSRAAIDNLDQIAVSGYVQGPGVTSTNDQALWLGAADGLPEVVMREGTTAPGLPGLSFAFGGDLPVGLGEPRFALNDAGDLLMKAGISGPGVSPANNVGLWFREGDSASWSLVLRTGDTFDGHTLATISFLQSFPAGFSRNLLDDGTFVLSLGFTDDFNGVYRFTVPEPSTATIFASLFATALVRARRRRRSRVAGPVDGPCSRATNPPGGVQ